MVGAGRKPLLISLDEDEQVGALIEAVATRAGFDAHAVASADSFREELCLFNPDVVVLALEMSEMDGVKTLRYLAEHDVKAAIVLVTGADQRAIASAQQYGQTRGLNIVAPIEKPFTPEELLDALLIAREKSGPLGVDELRTAMARGELVAHYQPTIRRAAGGTWDICAMEALLRWSHPKRGLLTPDAFIQVGERYGLGKELTDLVIAQSMQEIHGWRANNLDLGVRVNVSASLMTDMAFPDRLGAVLAAYEVDATLLTLEITEAGTLDQQADTLDILKRLRQNGVRLAIDDFGVGYSSLTQLVRLPFSEMKIDKSVVMRIPTTSEARITVEALVGLAHKLKLSVCAEGVETQATLDFLDGLGCDAAQGFLISPPIEAGAAADVVGRWNARGRNAARPFRPAADRS